MLIAWINEAAARLRGLFRRKVSDADFDAELRAHFELLVDNYRARGMSESEARRQAHIRMGGMEQIREAHRQQRGVPFLETLAMDVRYGARQLLRTPGFTVVAVLTIALGIGINTGVFSVLDAMALQPLVLRTGQTLVSVYPVFEGARHRNAHNSENMFSYAEYIAYRDENHVFSGLAGYVPFVPAIAAGERPQEIDGTLASCNYFDVLMERPAMGRAFAASDCAAPGANPVVVISDDYWRNALGADPEIIGKTISLNRTNLAIIGVAPRGFEGTEISPAAFWAPITMQPQLMPGRKFLDDPDLSWIAVIGRVKPRVSLAEANSEMAVITARLQSANTGSMRTVVRTASLFNRPEERGIIFTVGAVVLCAVALVLLIACANIANLLLARAAGRKREIAVRLALGASRRRLIRQMLTESLLLAAIGGALGTFLSFVSFDALLRAVIAHLPAGAPPLAVHLSPDSRVLAFALAITLLTGITFGLVPALQSSRSDVNSSLKDECADSSVRSARRGVLRNVLVGAQIAVCMTLLLTAGLLLRGLLHAQTIDPGFQMRGLHALTFDLTQQGYSSAQASALRAQLKERVSSLPGVESVAEASTVPLADQHWQTETIDAKTGASRAVSYNRVSPNFFSLLEIPIVHGRIFSAADAQAGTHPVIVTEALARNFWPGEDPLGKSLRVFGSGSPPSEVIGVAQDVQVDHLGEAHPVFLYVPVDPKDEAQTGFIIRSTRDDASTLASIRAAVHDIDPQFSFALTRLEDNLANFQAFSRIVAAVSGTLAALALLLASMGVYGLVSYAVSRRIREIGIRMALGADGRDVMKLILSQALRPVMVGALIGTVCCAGISRIFGSLLFGVSALDPLSFAVVPAFLIAVAALASYLPARKAMRVDPMVALRYE